MIENSIHVDENYLKAGDVETVVPNTMSKAISGQPFRAPGGSN